MATLTEEDDEVNSIISDASRFLPLLQLGDSEEFEWYRKGGFHPVHLGDLFDDGRYRIVHKLGSGGFSTVWLAFDNSLSTWVALKIVVARRSRVVEEKALICDRITSGWDDCRLVTYTRYFHINGPNGRHLCLVLPLLGPSCYSLSRYLKTRIRPWLAHLVASEAAKAVADLHARGLCHGGKLYRHYML